MGTILFVDDDRDSLITYQKAVSLVGHEAHLLENGEQTLARVDDLVPDVIVLDMNLPDMSGLTLLERLRSETSARDIPIVMLTAYSESKFADDVYAAGADAFFSKPLSLNDFLSAIEEYI